MEALLTGPVVGALATLAWWLLRRSGRAPSPMVADMLARPVLPALVELSSDELACVTREVLHREGCRAIGPCERGRFRVQTPQGRVALVHCRAWRYALVGPNQVRRFADVIERLGASEGVLASSGQFSDCAGDAAEGRSIRLLDGGAIVRRLEVL